MCIYTYIYRDYVRSWTNIWPGVLYLFSANPRTAAPTEGIRANVCGNTTYSSYQTGRSPFKFRTTKTESNRQRPKGHRCKQISRLPAPARASFVLVGRIKYPLKPTREAYPTVARAPIASRASFWSLASHRHNLPGSAPCAHHATPCIYPRGALSPKPCLVCRGSPWLGCYGVLAGWWSNNSRNEKVAN